MACSLFVEAQNLLDNPFVCQRLRYNAENKTYQCKAAIYFFSEDVSLVNRSGVLRLVCSLKIKRGRPGVCRRRQSVPSNCNKCYAMFHGRKGVAAWQSS